MFTSTSRLTMLLYVYEREIDLKQTALSLRLLVRQIPNKVPLYIFY